MTIAEGIKQTALQRAEAFTLPPDWQQALPLYQGYSVEHFSQSMLITPQDNHYKIGIADVAVVGAEKALLLHAVFGGHTKGSLFPAALRAKLCLNDKQERPGLVMHTKTQDNDSAAEYSCSHARLTRCNFALQNYDVGTAAEREARAQFTTVFMAANMLAKMYFPSSKIESRATLSNLTRVIGAVSSIAAADVALKNDIPVVFRNERALPQGLAAEYDSSPSKHEDTLRSCVPVAEPFKKVVSLVNVCNISSVIRGNRPVFTRQDVGRLIQRFNELSSKAQTRH